MLLACMLMYQLPAPHDTLPGRTISATAPADDLMT